uniref:Ig-like domain-containing protein n=1 Tax=Globodera pallida TaxID=36090 RepID=A0A183C5E6_GLOPA
MLLAFLVPSAFVMLLLSALSSLASASNNCPKLIDGQMLDFVNPGGVRLAKSEGGRANCARLLSCDVIGAPAERTNVRWYVNGRNVHSSVGSIPTEAAAAAAAMNAMDDDNVQSVSHRLCADRWMVAEGGTLLNLVATEMEFRCAASLDCGEQHIESDALLMRTTPGRRRRTTATGEKRLLGLLLESVTGPRHHSHQPPLISMVTSSRMELTGLPLRVACAADGMPRPEISWHVVGVDGTELDRPRPAAQFPFITERADGQLLINSSSSALRDVASLSLRCVATNGDGMDSAKSLVILLKDERK